MLEQIEHVHRPCREGSAQDDYNSGCGSQVRAEDCLGDEIIITIVIAIVPRPTMETIIT